MKSIDVRPDGHTINGRQNVPGAIGCGILLFLLLSMRSVFSEAIPDDLNQQLREILAQNQFTGQSSQRWNNVLAGGLIRRKRNSAAFCFSTSSSVCMAIIPAPDVIRL